MLVTLNEILPEARKKKRAVGAFNVANYEAALGVVRAAEREKLPVIIQIFQRLFVRRRMDKMFNIQSSVLLIGMLIVLYHISEKIAREGVKKNK